MFEVENVNMTKELCDIVYTSRSEFETKLRKTKVNYSNSKVSQMQTIKLILEEGITEHQSNRSTTGSIIFTKGYACRNIFAAGGPGLWTTYKIIPGPEKNSIILAEPVQNPEMKKFYIPIELIYNLHLEYIINFYKYF